MTRSGIDRRTALAWLGLLAGCGGGGGRDGETRAATLAICVSFVDRLHGYAGGPSGAILETRDGGINWVVLPSGVNLDVLRIVPVGLDTLWAFLGDGTVLRSVDNGKQWARIDPGFGQQLHSLAVTAAPDPLRLIVSGRIATHQNEPRARGTVDGGATWYDAIVVGGDDLELLASGVLVHSIVFSPPFTGGRMSNDFGRTWQDSAAPLLRWRAREGGGWYAVAATDRPPVEGDVFRTRFDLRTSDDGGFTWTTKPMVLPAASFSAVGGSPIDVIALDSLGRGWASASSSLYFRTDDGGSTWRLVEVPQQSSAGGFMTLDSLTLLYAPSDDEPPWLTVDSGDHWRRVAPWEGAIRPDVAVRDGGGAILVGFGIHRPDKRWYRSRDQGETWRRL